MALDGNEVIIRTSDESSEDVFCYFIDKEAGEFILSLNFHLDELRFDRNEATLLRGYLDKFLAGEDII